MFRGTLYCASIAALCTEEAVCVSVGRSVALANVYLLNWPTSREGGRAGGRSETDAEKCVLANSGVASSGYVMPTLWETRLKV